MRTDVLYNACLSLQAPSFVQCNMDMMVTSSDEEEADIENISPFDYKPRMYCSSELKDPFRHMCAFYSHHTTCMCVKTINFKLGVYQWFC